ncbi:hypothetical protein J2X21_000347 [Kinneretia asaccharophila]|uniref:DUF5117 domain-containing protein n=1 Tax=Roseateles asaccharophilus TaxID=582607 RepID=A0ABU2A2I6_9BURK|nr:hypothetical protein [Roseateles asaccharophilus]
MTNKTLGRTGLALLTLTLAAGQAMAQALPPGPTTPPAPSATAASAPTAPARPPVTLPDPGEPKPYDRVITAEAKTQQGLFVVHNLKNKLYFEIPKDLLEQPLLMVANATAVPAGQEHVGRTLNQDVLRFVLHQNRVLLQLVSHSAVTAPGNVLADAVRLSQRDAILAVFPVEAFAKSGAPVIEVTRLFNTEVGDFSARTMVRGNLDGSRSYVEKTKAFPGSVRVDAVQTYNVSPTPMPTLPGVAVVPAMQPARSVSLNLAYSIVQLPQKPMMPRLLDDRVGFFSVQRLDYGDGLQEARRERLITRWRLEKKDPGAPISEPVKPLVWYIDKATPTALVPYVKKGIEAWNSAFEAAGFKNAVQARPYPSAEEDPEFDPEDVRYSVVRWVPVAHPQCLRPAPGRSAQRRDPERQHRDVPQHHADPAGLVRHPGRPAGPACAQAAAARRPDGRAGGLRRHARDRAWAGLPAQHEEQLAVPRGQAARCAMAQDDGPHAVADGLQPLQLRGPARGQARPGAAHPQDRALRRVRHALGLHAHSQRQDARGGAPAAQPVGARAGRHALAAL